MQEIDRGNELLKGGQVHSALKTALKAINHTDELKGNLPYQKKANLFMSAVLAKLGAHREAIPYLHKAIFFEKKLLGKYDLNTLLWYGQIGSMYLEEDAADSCYKNFRKAIRMAPTLGYGLYHASSWNNMGLAHFQFNHLDSARFCFNKAKNLLKREGIQHDQFYTVVLSNLAELEEYDGNTQLAQKIMETAIDELNERHLSFVQRRPYYYAYLVKLMAQNGDFEKFSETVDSALRLLRPLPDNRRKYQGLLQVTEAMLNAGFAPPEKLYNQKANLIDSLNSILETELQDFERGLFEFKVAVMNQNDEINELSIKQKEQELRIARTGSRLALAVAALILITTTLLVLIIVQRNRKRTAQLEAENKLAELKIENQALKEKQLEQDIKLKSEDLTDLVLYNTQKNELTQQVIEKVKTLSKGPDFNIDKLIKQLEMELNQQVLSETKILKLQQNIDTVNAEFQSKLKAAHPELSLGELELCGLVRIKLSGKEIAQLRGVSPQSITKAKQRLRKKFNLPPHTNLYNYLKEM